jgi:ferritin-like metal-binding protein YciE
LLTLIMIFSAVAAAVAVIVAVRIFQMDNPGGAQEALSHTLAPPLYAMNTKIDTLQQSMSSMLAAAVQSGSQTLTSSVSELREETRTKVDEKLAGFATELRGTFDALAQWLESRLGAKSEGGASNPQLRAAIEERLVEVQNQVAASLDALHESIEEELRRARTESRESMAAVQQSLVEAFRMLQASHETRLETLRRAVEDRLLKDAERGFGGFKETIAELDRDPAREKYR